MKLSKQNRKHHSAALELLTKDKLTWEEQQFFFDNYFECADFDVSKAGAFFTPSDLALDAALENGQTDKEIHVLDLCAGIGVLSWAVLTRCPNAKVTAVEQNPKWVEIGKKLLPEVNWICADLAELDLVELGYFDSVVTNPPFGRVPTLKSLKCPRYTGSEAHYKVLDIASVMAPSITAIIPQQSCSWAYSKKRSFSEQTSKQLDRFVSETGIQFGMNMGIDTSSYDSFKATNITVEVVCCEYESASWEDFGVGSNVLPFIKCDVPPKQTNVVPIADAPDIPSNNKRREQLAAGHQLDMFG